MANRTDLEQIQTSLEVLQRRVRELTADPADRTDPEHRSGPRSSARPDTALMAALRIGLAELAATSQVKDVPEFFTRLVRKSNLRLVVLKRWRSGMQVFHSENIELPRQASRKQPDGRAPIPVEEDDVFATVGRERGLYVGPVPVKHFPLDLSLMLGRGSREKRIVILPIPAGERWNTFLYMDADNGGESQLAVVEILAHYALARMTLLNRGEQLQGQAIAGILKEELARRRQDQAHRAEGADWPVLSGTPADSAAARSAPAGKEPSPPAEADDSTESTADQTAGDGKKGPAADADLGAEPPGAALTPEGILKHSGELPALPRAACHIMAVIDNPSTTATKLEKAIALDQALTAKVLRIANSPFYGAVRDIRTVSEAIVRLGFVTIRNWTLVAATKSVFLTPGCGMLFQKIWRQSVLSAMASQLTAQAVGGAEPDTAFLGGLMQNIGQLVLARAQPELFHRIVEESAAEQRPYHEIERRLLGFDHGELGALLIREWNLSRDLEEAVRCHHRLAECPAARLPGIIALGEEIAACGSSAADDTGGSWEDSEPARVLEVPADLYAQLKAKSHDLSIDPLFFT